MQEKLRIVLAGLQGDIDISELHPREASRFCDDVRRRRGYFDLPDDIILRVIIMGRRKNP